MSELHTSKKKRYMNEDADLLKKVSTKTITKETLSEKLAQHVEQVTSFKPVISFHSKFRSACPFFGLNVQSVTHMLNNLVR